MVMNLIGSRISFNVGDEFHVFAGQQIEYGERMVVGHAHEYDHLMILLRPFDDGVCPEYEIGVETRDGKTQTQYHKPYGLALIRAGHVHWVRQTVPGAVGQFVCIFARRNPDGSLRPDPKKEREEGFSYSDG